MSSGLPWNVWYDGLVYLVLLLSTSRAIHFLHVAFGSTFRIRVMTFTKPLPDFLEFCFYGEQFGWRYRGCRLKSQLTKHYRGRKYNADLVKLLCLMDSDRGGKAMCAVELSLLSDLHHPDLKCKLRSNTRSILRRRRVQSWIRSM
jgi:hypothetical protein